MISQLSVLPMASDIWREAASQRVFKEAQAGVISVCGEGGGKCCTGVRCFNLTLTFPPDQALSQCRVLSDKVSEHFLLPQVETCRHHILSGGASPTK